MKEKSVSFSVVQFFLIFMVSVVLGQVKVEKVVDPVLHGEGPHWDSEKQVLYYVDISGQTVTKFDPKCNQVTRVEIDGGPVGFVIPDKLDKNKFVLGRGLDLVSMEWDGVSNKPTSLTVLSSVDQDKPGNRFNDGKADASGRIWAGTMGPENPNLILYQGSLYSFDWPDKFQSHKHVSPLSISNGLAWNDKNDLMYYIDSPTRSITVFDFDIIKGSISNPRVLFSLDKYNIPGVPDGMTIDRNGNLWVAVYKGSCILHIDTRNGELLGQIYFPVSQVTSCAFGGENLQDLYVTTSRFNMKEEDLKKEPLAGAVFRVTGLNVPGQIKSNKVVLQF